VKQAVNRLTTEAAEVLVRQPNSHIGTRFATMRTAADNACGTGGAGVDLCCLFRHLLSEFNNKYQVAARWTNRSLPKYLQILLRPV
jgi:hypothetical protein